MPLPAIPVAAAPAMAAAAPAVAAVAPAMTAISGFASSVLTAITSSVSPWMVAGLLINYASNIQSYKKAASLLFQVLTGNGESAKCGLCTELMDRMMDLTGASDSVEVGNRIDCSALCPFRLKRCMNLCSRLVEASRESATFPCVAIKMCPRVDQFGEVPSCSWDWKQAACTPAFVCERTRTFPFPKCEIHEGYAKWRQASGVVQQKAGAFFTALRSLRKCSDPGSDPHFCVKEAEGFQLFCEYLGWGIVVLVAPLQSVRAIETPGGGDDRQWLAFWIIFFLFSAIERFTLVILSQLQYYYAFKLLVIAWLCFFEGAGRVYLRVHFAFNSAHRLIRRNQAVRWLCDRTGIDNFFTVQEDKTEEECLSEYVERVNLAALAEVIEDARKVGLQRLFETFVSEEAIVAKYNERVLHALSTQWHAHEFRFLEIELESAENLPVMDFDWRGNPMACDPFVVFYLVPPARHPEPELPRNNSNDSLVSIASVRSVRSLSMEGFEHGLEKLGTVAHKMGDVVSHGSFSQIADFSSSSILGKVMPSGPRGAPGQYCRTKSRVVRQSLNPRWHQLLELELHGGHVDGDGNFINKDTPFTQLRVEVWDWDKFSNNDFIGECTVPLCTLMTGTRYAVERKLEDPEEKSAAKELSGSIRVVLRYTS